MELWMNWQSAMVLLLLIIPVFFSLFTRLIPRDLCFTIAALLSALGGIVSSSQLYQALANQTIFAVLGLWLMGKSMQQQGIFQRLVPYLSFVKKERPLGYLRFFLRVIVLGAFFHHRYAPLSMLRPLVREAEKKRGDLKIFGFPFAYLFLIGGLATAIGVPTNLLFLFLSPIWIEKGLFSFFIFLPFAVMPIFLSCLFLFFFRNRFHKPFAQFIDATACALVPPDSLWIGKKQSATVVRNGKTIARATPLQSGDLLLWAKTKPPFSQLALFIHAPLPSVQFKQILVGFLFLGAIIASLVGMKLGTAFLLAGLICLALRTFPIKITFSEEFPFPALLEIFSAYVFFFAMQRSGLDAWFAGVLAFLSPYVLLPLFFVLAQVFAHFMPRPVAFSILFSIMLNIVNGYPTQLVLAGITIAFGTAVPLFSQPLLDELAISKAVSGTAPLFERLCLLGILFISTVVPIYVISRLS
jgi:hypothetical protein